MSMRFRISLALLFTLLALPTAARAQDAIVGESWESAAGVRESLETILARNANPPPDITWQGFPRAFDPAQVNPTPNPNSPPYVHVGDFFDSSLVYPQTVPFFTVVSDALLMPVVGAGTQAFPPDSMGDIGLQRLLVVSNGAANVTQPYYQVRMFNRGGGSPIWSTTVVNFFASVRNGFQPGDPMVKYDRFTRRWFVSCQLDGTADMVLAVSDDDSPEEPIPGDTSWSFWRITLGNAGLDNLRSVDYLSMSVDHQAVYFGAKCPGGNGALTHSVFVIRKSTVTPPVNGTPGTPFLTAFRRVATSGGGFPSIPAVAGPYCPRACDNDDPGATHGYFVGVDATALGGQLTILRISTPGATPALQGPFFVNTPANLGVRTSPVQGTTAELQTLDQRLFHASIVKNRFSGALSLWTSHHVAVNASGVATNPEGPAARNAARWYEIGAIQTLTPTLLQTGLAFDSATSTPWHFIYPSVAVSAQGHMVMGMTYSASNQFAGVAVSGRYADQATGFTELPASAQAGEFRYQYLDPQGNRWGDYSVTSVDPIDGQSFYTFQEYANNPNDVNSNGQWTVGVYRASAPPPPVPNACSPGSIPQGSTGVAVAVTGPVGTNHAGFSDRYPGDAAQTTRLQATVSGTGVTVTGIELNAALGALGVQLTLNVASNATLGARTITVTNPDGQSRTSAGILTITAPSTPPSIQQQPPSSLTVCPTGSIQLMVSATGTAPLSFQWQRNAVNLTNGTGQGFGSVSGASATGVTSSTLSITSPTSTATGSYTCVVTNAAGTATSQACAVTVPSAPAITPTGHPVSVSTCVGGSASFSVVAAVTPCTLQYQWRRNGSNISGATSPMLTITNAGVSPNLTGSTYDCEVRFAGTSGAVGRIFSNAATLTALAVPQVMTHPLPQDLCVGGTISLTVAGQGTGLTFQWQRRGFFGGPYSDIDGANSPTYTAPGASPSQSQYRCMLARPGCTTVTFSNAVLVRVATGPFVNSANLVDPRYVCVGGETTFSVTADAQGPETYQWERSPTSPVSFTNISGANASTLVLSALATTDEGFYRCVVRDDCGPTNSLVAALTVVVGQPTFVTQPASYLAAFNETHIFTIEVSGQGTVTYQWYHDGVLMEGETGPTVTVTVSDLSVTGIYSCDVTNECGLVTSDPASLCCKDFNGDGFVDPDDLSDFITCFFLDVEFPGTCPQADFNHDGFRDPDDLSDFITLFFGDCT